VAYFASYIIKTVNTEKRDQMLADLEAETEAARLAIKTRYEKEAKAEGADVKTLAAQQSKELEDLGEDALRKKTQLESLEKARLISEVEYRNLPEEYRELSTVGMGGTALRDL